MLTKGEAPGKIALVTPDGETREVASELAFPNGMVITPDNKTLVGAESFAARFTAFDIADDGSLSNRRVWGGGVGPDGICLDADGCICASSANMANDCARIREGGEVLERIDLGRPCFATMLGGPDRRTLFMLAADWRGTEEVEGVIKARTGQVLVADAPAAPGVAGPNPWDADCWVTNTSRFRRASRPQREGMAETALWGWYNRLSPNKATTLWSTCKQSGNRGDGGFRSSRSGWHTQAMNALWLTFLLAAPWLAAVAYTWSRAPRMDGPPPSMAERTRERLWR